MNDPQIALVTQWLQAIGKQIDDDKNVLSDMDIIQFQALLMDNGADLFRAFKNGEMALVLSGLVNLAYSSLIAARLGGLKDDLSAVTVDWRYDGLMISIMRSLCHHIDACTSGKTHDYTTLFVLCKRLVIDFLNADFEKAFQHVHETHMQDRHIPISQSINIPDLSDCLFE